MIDRSYAFVNTINVMLHMEVFICMHIIQNVLQKFVNFYKMIIISCPSYLAKYSMENFDQDTLISQV
jgi:hypothetical protein